MMASINVFVSIDSHTPIHPIGCYVVQLVYQTRKTVFARNPKDQEESGNMMHSGVVMINLKVFGKVIKHCLEC